MRKRCWKPAALLLGAEHPATSTSAWNLVMTLADLGDTIAAFPLLKSDLLWMLDPGHRGKPDRKGHCSRPDRPELLFGKNHADRARAIALINANLTHIDKPLASFPDDVYLHALTGYAAKNVHASSGGTDLLRPAQREKCLDRARMHFETALRLDPDDPGAVNGKGNVLFCEGKLDEAIMYHERAIKLAGGSYPAAERDLNLVMRVKSGAVLRPQ